jgi:hypothetical protein
VSVARGWLIGVGLLVAAWFVAAATPDAEQRMTEPFRVTAEIGAPAIGDNIAVTVRDVVLSEGVTAGAWSAEGNWLVVDLEAWTTRSEVPGQIGAAYLVIGDLTLSASERPTSRDSAASIFRARLHVDIPQEGSLAFELPADLAPDAVAVVQLAQDNSAGRGNPALSLEGDSVIELRVPLAGLAEVSDRALLTTGWVNP